MKLAVIKGRKNSLNSRKDRKNVYAKTKEKKRKKNNPTSRKFREIGCTK